MRFRKCPANQVALCSFIVTSTLFLAFVGPAAHAESLTFPAIEALAERQAPRLLLAAEQIGIARAELVLADPSVPDNPVLELAGGPRFSGDGTSFAIDVAFTQSVFVAGERGARIAAAKKAVLAAEAARVVERWSLHAELQATFDAALVARERTRLLTEVEGFQRKLAEIASKKAKAGEIAVFEARLSDVVLAEAQQSTLAAQQAYRAACLRLAGLVGWTAVTPLEPDGVLEAPLLPPLASLVARSQAAEPELLYKEALIVRARARLDAERRDAAIRPAFGVALGHEGGIGVEPSVTTLQGIVSLPLPFSQQNQGNIARARAELRLAEAERAAHSRALEFRIAEAHAALAAAIARSAAFGDQILPLVSENLALLERAFAVGEIGLADATFAREHFVKARLDALDAHAARLTARADLERLVGADLEEVTP